MTDLLYIETQCGIPLTEAQQTSPPWVHFQVTEVSRSDEPSLYSTSLSPLAMKGAQADDFTHRHLYCEYPKLDRMDQTMMTRFWSAFNTVFIIPYIFNHQSSSYFLLLHERIPLSSITCFLGEIFTCPYSQTSLLLDPHNSTRCSYKFVLLLYKIV